MKKSLTTFLYLLVLFCGLRGFASNIAGMDVAKNQHTKECIEEKRNQEECTKNTSESQNLPFGPALCSSCPSDYIVCSRPSRALASQSCQSGRSLWHPASIDSDYLHKHSLLHLHGVALHLAGASSPRIYYVIALRRILC